MKERPFLATLNGNIHLIDSERTSTNIGREALVRQKKKSGSLPIEEASDYSDPCFFQTSEGWSPISLAIQLLTADPNKKETYAFTAFDFDLSADSPATREHIFLKLLQTKVALRESTQLPPPVIPSRFNQVSEDFCIKVILKFCEMCRRSTVCFEPNRPEHFAYEPTLLHRITHATFIAAAHANRMRLATALLDEGVCDPNCTAILPVELRPLHIVCASGFGPFAQLLLDYQADPSCVDENGRKPVEKLHTYYSTIIAEQSRKLEELQHYNGIMGRGPREDINFTVLGQMDE